MELYTQRHMVICMLVSYGCSPVFRVFRIEISARKDGFRYASNGLKTQG